MSPNGDAPEPLALLPEPECRDDPDDPAGRPLPPPARDPTAGWRDAEGIIRAPAGTDPADVLAEGPLGAAYIERGPAPAEPGGKAERQVAEWLAARPGASGPPERTAADAPAEQEDDPGWLAPGPEGADVLALDTGAAEAPEWPAGTWAAELALAAEQEGAS